MVVYHFQGIPQPNTSSLVHIALDDHTSATYPTSEANLLSKTKAFKYVETRLDVLGKAAVSPVLATQTNHLFALS